MANPNLLMLAPGFSSTSRGGSASTAIDRVMNPKSYELNYAPETAVDHLLTNGSALTGGGYGGRNADADAVDEYLKSYKAPAGGDKYRQEADEMVQGAANPWMTALRSPMPTMQHPRYNPLQSAGLLLAAGLMNAASPYSSEGNQMFDSLHAERERRAAEDYQTQMQQRQADIQAGQAGYQVARDRAAPLYDQANAADQSSLASQEAHRQQQLQFLTTKASWTQADHVADIQHQHDLQTEEVRFKNTLAQMHEQGNINKDLSDYQYATQMILKSPQARGVWMTDHFRKEGMAPAEAQRLGSLLGTMFPEETKMSLENQTMQEQLKLLQLQVKNQPKLYDLQIRNMQADIAAKIASANASNASASHSRALAAKVGMMTPDQALGFFITSMQKADSSYNDALSQIAKYTSDWNENHKFTLPNTPKQSITDDPVYKQLVGAMQRAKQDSEYYQGLGGKLLGLKSRALTADYGSDVTITQHK